MYKKLLLLSIIIYPYVYTSDNTKTESSEEIFYGKHYFYKDDAQKHANKVLQQDQKMEMSNGKPTNEARDCIGTPYAEHIEKAKKEENPFEVGKQLFETSERDTIDRETYDWAGFCKLRYFLIGYALEKSRNWYGGLDKEKLTEELQEFEKGNLDYSLLHFITICARPMQRAIHDHKAEVSYQAFLNMAHEAEKAAKLLKKM